jgi:2-iminobutanoate/2-iminopropanoate deaminase
MSKPSQSPMISRFRTVGDLVYTSGVTGAPGDVPTQIRTCFEKLKQILDEAGASLDTVLKATIYLTDLEDRSRYLNDIWREYFPVNPPGRTCVQAGLGENVKVEIEFIAAKKRQ